MADFKGADVTVTLNGSVVMCFRNFSMSWGGEPLDKSDSCSNGRRSLSDLTGQEQIDFTVDGVAGARFIKNLILSGGSRKLTDAVIQWPPTEGGSEGDSLTLDLVIADYSETGAYNELVTFSATLQSSDDWVYVPEA